MAKVNYKKLYEDKLVEEHTKRYIHIPFSWRSIGLFFSFLLSGALSVFNFIGLLKLGDLLDVWTTLNSKVDEGANLLQLMIVPSLIFEYVLVAFSIIVLVASFKGGFDKLKSYDEEGLIVSLIAGLIFGLFVGLFVGLIAGLIAGLIGGLIVGLIVGLIFGLFVGLIGEFDD